MIKPAVLYVEDEALSRKVMEMMLVGRLKLDHVSIFEDSQDIVERTRALDPQPDVIFLDIHMRPHNGFDVLEMLREIPSLADVPIVALTASVMNEEVQRLESAGFDGCLSKPIDTDTFSDNLNRILAGEEIWNIIS